MQKANIRRSWDHGQVDPSALKALYESVGFGFIETVGKEEIGNLFGSGIFGLFAFSGNNLVGAARVFSDELTVTWLAEICVASEWRGRNVDRSLMDEINVRFGKTALYCDAHAGNVGFFKSMGVRSKIKLNVCKRLPCEMIAGNQNISRFHIYDDARKYGAADFDRVADSVGFGISDKNMPREILFERLFGDGIYGAFAEDDDGRLIGFIRAFSDNLTKCYLAEICVHPDWQRIGVGSALTEGMVRRFFRTTIYTEAFPNAVPLFDACGVIPAPDLIGCSRAPLEE